MNAISRFLKSPQSVSLQNTSLPFFQINWPNFFSKNQFTILLLRLICKTFATLLNDNIHFCNMLLSTDSECFFSSFHWHLTGLQALWCSTFFFLPSTAGVSFLRKQYHIISQSRQIFLLLNEATTTPFSSNDITILVYNIMRVFLD